MAEDEEGVRERRFERKAGLSLAVLAAFLAVNDLFGGKYGDDEILGSNEKASAYAWYQSKSQKQTLQEHQLDMLETLVAVGTIAPDNVPEVAPKIAHLKGEIDRYKLEKKEILAGSAGVGPDHWILTDEEGNKGTFVGADEWKVLVEKLGAAGDKFDLGTLFLQMSLVLGAISLVLEDERLKRRFYAGMIGMGSIGTVFTVWALALVWM